MNINKIVVLLLSCTAIQNPFYAMERKSLTKTDLLVKDIIRKDIEDIERLLNTGMDVNVPDRSGQIPLFIAIDTNQPEITRLLLRHGANPNLQDKAHYNGTALHCAVNNDNAQIIKLLLAKGADANKQDIHKNTPLHLAVLCDKPGIARFLINNSANIDQKNGTGNTPLTIAQTLHKGSMIRIIQNYKKKMAILHGWQNNTESPVNLLPGDEELLKYILFNI